MISQWWVRTRYPVIFTKCELLLLSQILSRNSSLIDASFLPPSLSSASILCHCGEDNYIFSGALDGGTQVISFVSIVAESLTRRRALILLTLLSLNSDPELCRLRSRRKCCRLPHVVSTRFLVRIGERERQGERRDVKES